MGCFLCDIAMTKRRAKSNACALQAIDLWPKNLNPIIPFKNKAKAIFSSLGKNHGFPSPIRREYSQTSDPLAHPDQVVKTLYQVGGTA